MKICTKCGETKPLDAFHKHSRSPDGRKPCCKECRKQESRDYYTANTQRIRADALRWQRENPEAAAAKTRRYRSSAKGRATREAWDERSDQKGRDRAYYAANAERLKAYQRARQLKIRGVTTEVFQHAEIFDRDGWVCQLCNEPVDRNIKYPHPQSVSLDHIIPIARGGLHSRANTQTAHLICNRRKGVRLVA